VEQGSGELFENAKKDESESNADQTLSTGSSQVDQTEEDVTVYHVHNSQFEPYVEERLEDFSRIGYRVLRVSAKTGEGMDALRFLVKGRTSVLLGQSGVGKSSLINALIPGQCIKVGDINEKYDRGNHTTTMSFMVGTGDTRIIDTPGIRRFVPDGIAAEEIIFFMREFAPLAGKCTYGLSCSHRTEPGCKILEAVTAGEIHEDRYESFLRIREELAGLFQ
jgi:ribosome biogenesis GTPase